MADIKELLSSIVKGIEPALTETGFKAVVPNGTEKGELPVSEENGALTLNFSGDKGFIKMSYKDERLELLSSDDGEEFKQIELSLLELATADDKDIKYIVNEYQDTIRQKFAKKQRVATKSKLPTPVSKSAAKSGALAYDPNTLANRFTTIFPELREEYRLNIERYGEFLPEDFFLNYGNAKVIETIRANDKQKMKKLFNLLNDIYEDGTNETQSLIAVTILGEMHNDPALLENAEEYMSETMNDTVVEVNKYLAGLKGRRDKKKLLNPPAYKPKKAEKEKSMFRQSLGM